MTIFIFPIYHINRKGENINLYYECCVNIAAYQCSKRGGEILCSINGDRVELTGAATIVLKGEIFVPYGRVTMGKKGHYF